MTSDEYWRKREEEALKHNITDEKEFDKRIHRIHSDMLAAAEKEINAFYGRYASKEGITIAEAKKRVSKADIADYERKAKRYVRDKDFSARANEEMRLYNASMRINRLEMLKANIGLDMIAGHDELEKFMAGILRGRTEDELARQAGILGKTIRTNAKKAAAIVNASFHNATFSDRIWQYQDILKGELSKLLTSGLIQGKNPRVLARELKKTFNTSIYNVERLMRTELARVQTEAQKQSFIRNGFDEYTFIVNGGCCDICAGLSGKHFKVAKMMPGENAPPMHPHCRCSTAAYADDAEYEAWLDYLDKGGTTADWNAFAKAEWEKANAKNHKRAGMAALIGGNGIPMHEEPTLLKEIDATDAKAVMEQLQSFEKSAIMERTETACVVTRDGKVYKCFGVKDRVFPDSDLGKHFVGASVTHNHPISETVFSFSEDDLWTFLDYDISIMRGCDKKYTYQFTRNADDVDDYEDIDIGSMTIDDFQHIKMIQLARQHGIGYRRWKND